jgi:hypothetical protein
VSCWRGSAPTHRADGDHGQRFTSAHGCKANGYDINNPLHHTYHHSVTDTPVVVRQAPRITCEPHRS